MIKNWFNKLDPMDKDLTICLIIGTIFIIATMAAAL